MTYQISLKWFDINCVNPKFKYSILSLLLILVIMIESKCEKKVSPVARFRSLSLEQRLAWINREYSGKWLMSTSFGIQSAVLLHALSSRYPKIPIIFIDTGYLFKETYAFAISLTKRLSLNLFTYGAMRSPAYQEVLFGKRWEKSAEDLANYNMENKIEPMNRAIEEFGASAWVSGIRWTQSKTRKKRSFIEKQNKVLKIYPILDWTDKEIFLYLKEHNLPYHPLWNEGYVSVGDVHSTKKLSIGMSEEDTRFSGYKRECGLHEDTNNIHFQI